MGIIHTTKYRRGAAAEDRWCQILADRGRCVIPLGAHGDDSGAPVLWKGLERVVLPDVFDATRRSFWEVKTRTRPSSNPKTGDLEYAIDYGLYLQYKNISKYTGFPVRFAVYEENSPAGGSCWLTIALETIAECGRIHTQWPRAGGEGSRECMGGIFWPRKKMRIVKEGY